MGCVDVVDDIPVVRNLEQVILEGWKTYSKTISYRVNIFNSVSKSVSLQDYKIENSIIFSRKCRGKCNRRR